MDYLSKTACQKGSAGTKTELLRPTLTFLPNIRARTGTQQAYQPGKRRLNTSLRT